MEQPGAAGAEQSFSILGLILGADPVVQAVMAGLALVSMACWAIIFEKTIRLGRLGRDVRRLEAAAASPASPLDADGAGDGLLGAVLAAARREHDEDGTAESRGETRARIERAMRQAMRTELRRVEGGLPFLATVGSVAPFAGLFGTVWGIMNSFASIARAKDTSLAVVAPGIAEALFATALGLAAAIPAVVAFNQIGVSLGRAANRSSPAIAELARRLARESGAERRP